MCLSWKYHFAGSPASLLVELRFHERGGDAPFRLLDQSISYLPERCIARPIHVLRVGVFSLKHLAGRLRRHHPEGHVDEEVSLSAAVFVRAL